jgi:RNA polymerase sigma-32 factor
MINLYGAKINQLPVLTPEEEFELAVRYRKHGDLAAAHKLITSNLRFVVKVALGYRAYGIPLSDLVQEGSIGLMMALKKFDPYKRYRFISYAVWWIRAYIQNFIMRNWSLVKIGTTSSEKKLFYKIGKVREALEFNQGKEDKYRVVATTLGVGEEDIMEMEQRIRSRDFSLDNTFDENNELAPLDLLQENDMNQEESLAQEQESKFQRERILGAMKCLNKKETYVIRNRVMADHPLTLQEIGSRLKLSRERIRQIEGEALMKLKRELRDRETGPRPVSSLTDYPMPTLENSHAMDVSLRQKTFQRQTLSGSSMGGTAICPN